VVRSCSPSLRPLLRPRVGTIFGSKLPLTIDDLLHRVVTRNSRHKSPLFASSFLIPLLFGLLCFHALSLCICSSLGVAPNHHHCLFPTTLTTVTPWKPFCLRYNTLDRINFQSKISTLFQFLFTAIMFRKILNILPFIQLTLAVPTSNLLPRDGTGSVVTAPNALAWYSSALATGTSGLADPSSYTCYTGAASNFPEMSTWVSFSQMWNDSLIYTFAYEPNTKAQTQDIYNSIVSVSKAAKVDARVILATILLESSGNLSVACSLSPAGQIPNCGLMQR
jgi:hypothetical protein